MHLRDFIGNRRLLELLRPRQLPQASLFAGPEGVGKKTLALALAGLSNCREPVELDLCGRCSSCVKAAAGHHPDIRLFQPERNLIRIDSMREMSREAQFRPFQGKLRFFIVDQAEKMNEEAANSILKTLEEPPDTSRIVLVSAFAQLLLPTLRSRCQIFSFQPLTRAQTEELLRNRCPPQETGLRAAFSEGSIGKALSLDLKELLAARDRMLKLLLGWFERRSFAAVFEAAESAPLRSELKNREITLRYLDLLRQLCEDLYFLLVGTPERVVNCDRVVELEQLSRGVDLDWLRKFLYHTERSRWEVEHYGNPLICFETLWLKVHDAGNHHREVGVL